MASDANPPPDRWCLLNDAPVVVEWPGGIDGHAAFIGHARPATLLLAHDAAQQTAAFRIRIPFQLQSSRKGHGYLYAFIDPATIILVQRRSRDASLPEPVAHSLVGKRSAHGIVGLELDLSKPPVIVGPANATKLSPRGDAAGNTLASLRLLSHATQVTLFVPQTSRLRDGLQGFCMGASGGSLSASTKDHALDMLYMGEGGKDVGGFLAPFEFRQADAQESDEAPPSYDEAIPVPSKRPASRETSSPPPRKKTVVPASESQPTSPQQPEPTLAQLHLELDILKQQMAFRAGTPTEDGSLLDRFDGFEQRLAALEARVANQRQGSMLANEDSMANLVQDLVPRLLGHLQARVDECLNERLSALLDAGVNKIMEEKQVDENFNELLKDKVDECVANLFEEGVSDRIESIEEDVFAFKDEVGTLVRDELAAAVANDLPDMVAEQLPEVVGEVLEGSNITVQVPRFT